MTEINQKRAKSFRIVLYEIMQEKWKEKKLTLLVDIANRLPEGLTEDEFGFVVNELEQKEFVKFEPGQGVRARFHPGPCFVLWSQSFEKESSRHVINIKEMHNSQIQQGVKNSSQTLKLTASQEKEFNNLLNSLKDEILTLKLSQQDQEDLNLELATLENQAKSTRRKKTIIQESIDTITNIVQGAAGSGLWAILTQLNGLF